MFVGQTKCKSNHNGQQGLLRGGAKMPSEGGGGEGEGGEPFFCPKISSVKVAYSVWG